MSYFTETLNEALREIGCDTSQYHFDHHSTIAMSFSDVGDILTVPRDDDFFIWNELMDTTEFQIFQRAEGVLGMLLEPCVYLEGETLSLRTGDPNYWIGGLLEKRYTTDTSLLADALADYHDRAIRVRTLLA